MTGANQVVDSMIDTCRRHARERLHEAIDPDYGSDQRHRGESGLQAAVFCTPARPVV